MRGFVHGPPGTGKSRLIFWIRKLFLDALGWEHGVQYMCVAFQNRVAYAMQGVTLHAGGEVPVGAAHRSLEHSDVDSLFTKNQALRWVLIDEVGMISDNLLGTFELNISDAALHCRFSHGSDKKRRPFGGYNLLTFGDLYQIPPIPASAALCIPSADGKSQQERAALNLFWSTNPAESFNFFAELKVQKRVVGDLWYASFLEECRFGRLSDENYNFLLGLPTLHAGCWPFFKEYQCQTPRCQQLHDEWRELMMRGASWSTCQELECDMCKKERERRNRVITSGEKGLHKSLL